MSSPRLPERSENFVKALIASGRYADLEEILGDALRYFQETDGARYLRPQSPEELRDAIAYGDRSGKPIPLEDAIAEISRDLQLTVNGSKKSAAA
jgi:putative addiction module CopG family antidote